MWDDRRGGASRRFAAKALARAGVILLATIVPGACASSANRGPESAARLALQDGTAHPLQPGDAIRLSFSREPALNGQFSIDETGSVVLPLLGSRPVADRAAPEVKKDLVKAYEGQTRNQSVQVVYLRRVRVLGEVRSPGLYHVDPTMTFEDALALAGGAGPDGDLKNVTLVRNGEEVVEGFDVSRSVVAGLQSGDQIYVPKTRWLSRYGAVVIGATISALGAIIAWGG